MSTNSKAALLEWFNSGDRMLNCDSIFAIDKNKANALLTQEYIRRFHTGSYLSPVNGETPPDNGYKVYMQNFMLDHPRLSFDNAEITSSRASLRMKIVGGNQVGLKQVGAHWYPQRIDRIEPLVGPELRLRLELTDVPGYVSEEANLILDLRNSDDFVLTFSDSRRIRELGGDFFKTLFRALPDSKRIWSLGRIEHGDDELLRPESFRLFTQRNPAVELSPMDDGDEDVDGAVLGLVSMVAGTGKPDTPGPEYRYLIPDDSDDYSASVVFERSRVALATVMRHLPRDIFKDVEFKLERTPDGGLSAIATAGELRMDAEIMSPSYEKTTSYGRVHCVAGVLVHTKSTPLAGILKIDVTGDRVTLEIVSPRSEVITLVTGYTEIIHEPGPWINPDWVKAWWKADTSFEVRGEWRMKDLQGARLELSSFTTETGVNRNAERVPPFGPDPGRELDLEHGLFVLYLASNGFYQLLRSKAYGPIRDALAKDLASNFRMDEVVENTIKLNFGGAIVSREQHMLRDIVCFGHVDPRSTTFTVIPLEKILVQGDKLQLACVPAQPGVKWSAESVEGATDDAGHFDQNTHGLYLAPGSTGIKGEFTRVRVTATDPVTGFFSSALLTVVKHALQVSPLLEVCQAGDEGVSLKADHVAGGDLQWRILGSQPFGQLAHTTGKANTYRPGADVAGKSFVVEEVEVSNRLTDERRTLCMVTQMTGNRPADVLVDKRDDTLGRVWLSISAGGMSGVSELTVVHGPGRIDTDQAGKPYYQATAESSAHFCVVRAFWEPMPGFPFNFEGFIVLPLPLGAHVNAYQALEQSAQRVLRR
ncbi:hypothetical protein ACIPZ8_16430 [Pseudomonas sp. NPDC089422]|uniref:hypothetical protein n=1 Tax=Pseudomonas sp. NPDC089422 TaxID=3364466 RepID=UPI0037F8EF9B